LKSFASTSIVCESLRVRYTGPSSTACGFARVDDTTFTSTYPGTVNSLKLTSNVSRVAVPGWTPSGDETRRVPPSIDAWMSAVVPCRLP
jgi:hypothetical protein